MDLALDKPFIRYCSMSYLIQSQIISFINRENCNFCWFFLTCQFLKLSFFLNLKFKPAFFSNYYSQRLSVWFFEFVKMSVDYCYQRISFLQRPNGTFFFATSEPQRVGAAEQCFPNKVVGRPGKFPPGPAGKRGLFCRLKFSFSPLIFC